MKWTNVDILSRLAARFKLRSYPEIVESMQLPPIVVAITDSDRLLMDIHPEENLALDLSGVAGQYVAGCVCPAGKRWTLKGVGRGGTTGSSYLMLKYAALTTPIPLSTSGTGQEYVLMGDTPIEAGDGIGMRSTANGGDTSADCYVVAIEEAIY